MKKLLTGLALAPLAVSACSLSKSANNYKTINTPKISTRARFDAMTSNAINDSYQSTKTNVSTRSIEQANVSNWTGTRADTWVRDVNANLAKASHIKENNIHFTMVKGTAVTNTTPLTNLLASLTATTKRLYGQTDTAGKPVHTPGFTCATTNLLAPKINNATFTFNKDTTSGYVIEFDGAECNSLDGQVEKESEAIYYVSKEDANNKFVIAEIENSYENNLTQAEINNIIPEKFKSQISINATLEGEAEGLTAGIRGWGTAASTMAFNNDFSAGNSNTLLEEAADYAILIQTEELEVEAEHGNNELTFNIENTIIRDDQNVLSTFKEIEFDNETNESESYEYWSETIIGDHKMEFSIVQDEKLRSSFGTLDLINTSNSSKATLELKVEFLSNSEESDVTIRTYAENGTKKTDFPILKYRLLTDDADDIGFKLLANIK